MPRNGTLEVALDLGPKKARHKALKIASLLEIDSYVTKGNCSITFEVSEERTNTYSENDRSSNEERLHFVSGDGF